MKGTTARPEAARARTPSRALSLAPAFWAPAFRAPTSALLLAGALALAGCGVEGEPVAPAASPPGVSVSGEASFGATGQL